MIEIILDIAMIVVSAATIVLIVKRMAIRK